MDRDRDRDRDRNRDRHGDGDGDGDIGSNHTHNLKEIRSSAMCACEYVTRLSTACWPTRAAEQRPDQPHRC